MENNIKKLIWMSVVAIFTILLVSVFIFSILNNKNGDKPNIFTRIYDYILKQLSSIFNLNKTIPINSDCTKNPNNCEQCTICATSTKLILYRFVNSNCPDCKVLDNNFDSGVYSDFLKQNNIKAYSRFDTDINLDITEYYRLNPGPGNKAPSIIIVDEKSLINGYSSKICGPYRSMLESGSISTCITNYTNNQKKTCQPVQDNLQKSCTTPNNSTIANKPGVCISGLCKPIISCIKDQECGSKIELDPIQLYCGGQNNKTVFETYNQPKCIDTKCNENFTIDELKEVCKIGCKNGYCTHLKVLIYANDSDYNNLDLSKITIEKQRISNTTAQSIIKDPTNETYPSINSPTIILTESVTINDQDYIAHVLTSSIKAGSKLTINSTIQDIISNINGLMK